jgi:protein KRI1
MRAANLQNALRSPSPEAEPAVITHAEEQRRLRDETIAAFHAAEGDEEEDFLVPREKTLDEVAREEEEYRRFLENEVGDLRELVDVGGSTAVAVEEPAQEEEEEEGAKKKKKKDKKKKKEAEKKGSDEAAGAGKNKQEEDQEFLVKYAVFHCEHSQQSLAYLFLGSYILNRGWIDRSSKRVPTYGEVTSQSKKKGKAKAQPADDSGSEGGADAGADDTDEEEVFDDIVDRFESSYNFRFEEA